MQAHTPQRLLYPVSFVSLLMVSQSLQQKLNDNKMTIIVITFWKCQIKFHNILNHSWICYSNWTSWTVFHCLISTKNPINAAAVFSWKPHSHGALPLTFRDISCLI